MGRDSKKYYLAQWTVKQEQKNKSLYITLKERKTPLNYLEPEQQQQQKFFKFELALNLSTKTPEKKVELSWFTKIGRKNVQLCNCHTKIPQKKQQSVLLGEKYQLWWLLKKFSTPGRIIFLASESEQQAEKNPNWWQFSENSV